MPNDAPAQVRPIDGTQKQVVEAFATRVRTVLGANLVRLHWFGSRVRKAEGDDADFDLVVETREALSDSERDAVADVTIDTSADYGVLLDVHFYTQDEFRGVPYSRTPFVQAVLEEGVLI